MNEASDNRKTAQIYSLQKAKAMTNGRHELMVEILQVNDIITLNKDLLIYRLLSKITQFLLILRTAIAVFYVIILSLESLVRNEDGKISIESIDRAHLKRSVAAIATFTEMNRKHRATMNTRILAAIWSYHAI